MLRLTLTLFGFLLALNLNAQEISFAEWVFLSREDRRLPTKVSVSSRIELSVPRESGRRVWDDDYSNILELLRDKTPPDKK